MSMALQIAKPQKSLWQTVKENYSASGASNNISFFMLPHVKRWIQAKHCFLFKTSYKIVDQKGDFEQFNVQYSDGS